MNSPSIHFEDKFEKLLDSLEIPNSALSLILLKFKEVVEENT